MKTHLYNVKTKMPRTKKLYSDNNDVLWINGLLRLIFFSKKLYKHQSIDGKNILTLIWTMLNDDDEIFVIGQMWSKWVNPVYRISTNLMTRFDNRLILLISI